MLNFYVSKKLPSRPEYFCYVVVHLDNLRPYRVYSYTASDYPESWQNKWIDFHERYDNMSEFEDNFRQVEASECSESDKIVQSLITVKELFERFFLGNDAFNKETFLKWYTGPHVNDYDNWISIYRRWLTFKGNETEIEKNSNIFDFRVYSNNEGFKVYEAKDVIPENTIFVRSFRFKVDANNFIISKQTKKENSLIDVMKWIVENKKVLRSSNNGESWEVFDVREGVSNDYIYKLAKVYTVTVVKRVVAESEGEAYEALKNNLTKEDVVKIEQM